MSVKSNITYWADSDFIIYGPIGNNKATFQYYTDRGLQIRKVTEVVDRTEEIITPRSEPIVHWDGTPIMEPRKRTVLA